MSFRFFGSSRFMLGVCPVEFRSKRSAIEFYSFKGFYTRKPFFRSRRGFLDS